MFSQGNTDKQRYNIKHMFEIKYKVNNIIKHNEHFDELYWNIIGDRWNLDIDKMYIMLKKLGIATRFIQKEGETRKSPVDIENSNYIMDMDCVVMAVGGKVDKDIIEKCNIETTSRKYVQVNENNQTSHEKVFAGGDVVGQNSTVAWAASDGRKVANKIIEYLETK